MYGWEKAKIQLNSKLISIMQVLGPKDCNLEV